MTNENIVKENSGRRVVRKYYVVSKNGEVRPVKPVDGGGDRKVEAVNYYKNKEATSQYTMGKIDFFVGLFLISPILEPIALYRFNKAYDLYHPSERPKHIKTFWTLSAVATVVSWLVPILALMVLATHP